MAKEEDVEAVIKRFGECRPDIFLKKVDETNVGIDLMLRLLCTENGELSPGAIAERMDVSTARVAVLLRKTEARGLIEKGADPEDARRTRIRISDAGKRRVRELDGSVRELVGEVIDGVGMEKLTMFIDISEEIRDIILPNAEKQNAR